MTQAKLFELGDAPSRPPARRKSKCCQAPLEVDSLTTRRCTKCARGWTNPDAPINKPRKR